uniref:G-protein coupled receptors family 1 profile domain-containing protein n=1 Tax=Clastoptera arizonana TaxID=38151 RepID=A0A1B6D5L0_9HEMI
MAVPHLRHHHYPAYLLDELNLTSLLNFTSLFNTSNDSTLEAPKNNEYATLYIYITSILIILCVISIAVNIVILTSALWIRGRVSSTLHISLSLAGADTFTLFMLALHLLMNSLMPVGLKVNYFRSNVCFLLFIESLRLGGIMTTMLHLLALAGHHYIGILLPLHHLTYLTPRTIHYAALFLWLLPSAFFLIYFSTLDNDGFNPPNCTIRFMTKKKFRSDFSMMFFTCLLLLIFIYVHIITLVRRHQESREKYRSNSQNGGRSKVNEKALLTTLLILGSIIVGWLPAVIFFYLSCDDGCMYKVEWKDKRAQIIVSAVIQALIICKNASNTYIYAFRMREIKTAISKMRAQLLPCCGGPPPRTWNSEHAYSQTSTRRTHRSVVYRLHSFPEPTRNGSQRNGSDRSNMRLHSFKRPPDGYQDQTFHCDDQANKKLVNTSL